MAEEGKGAEAGAGDGQAPAGAAGGQQGTQQPGESMVSLAALREAQADRDAARAELATLRTTLEATATERDNAVTGLRRATVRMATGIDDDQIADMAHSRWEAAMEGVEADKRQDIGDYWKALAADDSAREGLPKALRVYLPEKQDAGVAGAQAGRVAGAAPATRQPGTPAGRGKSTPQPGATGEITPESFRQMTPEQQRQVKSSFWRAAGVV